MKKPLFPIIIFLLICKSVNAQQAGNAIAILQKTAATLEALQNINYHYARELNYFKENNFSKAEADCYLEFKSAKVSRFQISSQNLLQIYNGTEYFHLNKNEKTYALEAPANTDRFSSFSFFYNSIPSVRSMIRSIIKDDSITKTAVDTVVLGKKYSAVKLAMNNKDIGYLGSHMHFTVKITLFYTILINPLTGMPYRIIQSNSLSPKDYTVATFTNIETNTLAPAAPSWFYSTYTNEYLPMQNAVVKPLVAVGTVLKDWSLPLYSPNGNQTFLSSRLVGKVTFIELWIKNCGYCMESFPVLKDIQLKFEGKQVQILTINAYDNINDIKFFYNREKPGYKMLYSGASFAVNLGVLAYPTAILLDKTGKVIYAGGFGNDNKAEIEKLIAQNL